MISKDILFEEYVVKEKPMYQIADEQGIAVGTVYNYLKKYGIPGRRYHTLVTREKISRANMGRPSPKKGVPMSDETKQKLSIAKRGKYLKPSEFGGHRKKRSDGYIKVFVPNHPYATKDGYVMEHILVMEKAIGHYIDREHVVHHINHIRDDNRLENLKLMTFKEHAGFHMRERYQQKKGEMTY